MKFNELSNIKLYEVLALRFKIFVLQQNCIYLDPDGFDLNSETYHLLGYLDNKLVAYLRVLPKGCHFPNINIGRVLIDTSVRNQGLADTMLEICLQKLNILHPHEKIELAAQAYLVKFYAKHGFVKTSQEYLDAGITHINMEYIRT